MRIVNLLIVVLLFWGCAPDSSHAIRTGEAFPVAETACEVGEAPKWSEYAWALGTAGDNLLLHFSRGYSGIFLVEPRQNHEIWRWSITMTDNVKGSERMEGDVLLIQGRFRQQAEILEVVGDNVVFSDGGVYAGVMNASTGATVLRFGAHHLKHFAVEYDVEPWVQGGAEYTADESGVTIAEAGDVRFVPNAELWACEAHDHLILISVDGTATGLQEQGTVDLGQVERTEVPMLLYSEAGALRQITARGAALTDSGGTCWTAPLPVRQLAMTSAGFAALTDSTRVKRAPGEAHFFEFDEARDVAPCRRVTSQPRLVDLRPVKREE